MKIRITGSDLSEKWFQVYAVGEKAYSWSQREYC